MGAIFKLEVGFPWGLLRSKMGNIFHKRKDWSCHSCSVIVENVRAQASPPVSHPFGKGVHESGCRDEEGFGKLAHLVTSLIILGRLCLKDRLVFLLKA